MKLKSKEQELEQLVEADFLEAEAVAVAEVESEEEAQRKVSPYRVNQDLSWKLYLPSDMEGLMELAGLRDQKKRQLTDEKESKCEYGGGLGSGLSLISGIVGAIPGVTLAMYSGTSQNPLGFFAGMALAVGGEIGGIYTGLEIGKKIHLSSQKYKDFERQKAAKIQDLEEQIKAVEQKLSHYEKSYRCDDIVLFNDVEKGYGLGRAVKNDEDEIVIEQKRKVFTIPNNPHHRNYGHYAEHTVVQSVEEERIVSVLRPSVQLSTDDLRHVDEKTPILCFPAESAAPTYKYGFIEKKVKDDERYFTLHALYYRPGPGEHFFEYRQIEQGMIQAYLLVPELKPRINL